MFFEEAQKHFAPLRIYKFSQFTATKEYCNDGKDNGKSAYIYLKGMGHHICGYYHSSKTHYASVGCHRFGGHAEKYASTGKWAACISWYVPILATDKTYYSYGAIYSCFITNTIY